MRRRKLTGTLLIINKEKHLAKILLPRGDETGIIKVPKSYETGDIIEFNTMHIAKQKKIIIISATSPHKYFGRILFDRKTRDMIPRIICTYPSPSGLLAYNKNIEDLAAIDHLGNVEFEIFKNKNGRTTAIELKPPKPADLYKCYKPKHAHINKLDAVPGYVSHIFKDEIEITIGDKQHTIFSSVFSKIHKASIKLGDIVSCQNFNRNIKVLPEESNDLFQVILANNPNREKSLLHGKIDFYRKEKKFGFIVSDQEKYYFHISDYLKSYHEYPSRNKEVRFHKPNRAVNRHKPNQLPTIKQFEQTPIVSDSSKFSDFVFPQKDEIYRVYLTRDSAVKEIQRSKPEELPYAIDMTNDWNLPAIYKLPALETIIRHKFSNQKHKTKDFEKQYLNILKNVISKHIAKEEFDIALQYEYILQNIEYDPRRLKIYSQMSSWIKPIPPIDNIQDINSLTKMWNIPEKEMEPILTNTLPSGTWHVDLSTPKVAIKEYNYKQNWKVMLDDDIQESLINNTDNSYYNINIRGNNE